MSGSCSSSLRVFSREILDRLSQEALRQPRLRLNLNLHVNSADPCQRLFNAIEPGSYLRPHRHLQPPKSETLIVLRGLLLVVIFADDGAIESTAILSPSEELCCVVLEAGCWHTVCALEPGTIVFEVKPGPYLPLDESDKAAWAPGEGAEDAVAYLHQLVTASVLASNQANKGDYA